MNFIFVRVLATREQVAYHPELRIALIYYYAAGS